MLDASNLVTRGYRNNEQISWGLSGDRRLTTSEEAYLRRRPDPRSAGEDFGDAGAEVLKRTNAALGRRDVVIEVAESLGQDPNIQIRS